MRAVCTSSGAAVALVATASLISLAGCAEKGDAKDSGAIQVTASDTACEVSKKEFPAGHVELSVENKGSKVTEVYIYAPDNTVVTERENIGPGTTAGITVELQPGSYEIACKPGMKGDGVRQKVRATGQGAAGKRDPRLDKAVAEYRTYVQTQADETMPKVKAFAAAVKKGDLEGAKKAYAVSRIGWERTEPVAESFGDIDPKVDLREDGLEQGQEWTGWHRLEKALWQDK
jgi:iron uptake system component EfeO